jgi:DNA-binding NtrC family response regulator
VVTLRLPTLAERPDDLPLLAEYFLKELAEEHGKEPPPLSAEALEAMSRYEWPGNVRQLKNILESMLVFHPGGEIPASALPPEIREATRVSGSRAAVQPLVGPPRTMEEIERQAILETLQRTDGHRAAAAKMLGIGLRTLQRKLKDYRDQGYYED